MPYGRHGPARLVPDDACQWGVRRRGADRRRRRSDSKTPLLSCCFYEAFSFGWQIGQCKARIIIIKLSSEGRLMVAHSALRQTGGRCKALVETATTCGITCTSQLAKQSLQKLGFRHRLVFSAPKTTRLPSACRCYTRCCPFCLPSQLAHSSRRSAASRCACRAPSPCRLPIRRSPPFTTAHPAPHPHLVFRMGPAARCAPKTSRNALRANTAAGMSTRPVTFRCASP